MGLVFLLWFFLRISKFIRCQAAERFIQFFCRNLGGLIAFSLISDIKGSVVF